MASNDVETKSLSKQKRMDNLVDQIKQGKYTQIVVMVGAGISTSCGIPDFRSANTGLYSQIAIKYPELTDPTDIFSLKFFQKDPKPFFRLVKELYPEPGRFKPSKTHEFLKQLQDKNILQRVYTQNIDGLEFEAGLRDDLVIQAHGGFRTCRCIKCGATGDSDLVKKQVMDEVIPYCTNGCKKGVIKPDITFFGENLPQRFFNKYKTDLTVCDLLIVIGTSLKVYPFANMINDVGKIPRILINRDRVGARKSGAYLAELAQSGQYDPYILYSMSKQGMDFDNIDSDDFFLDGECDAVIERLSTRLGLDNNKPQKEEKDTEEEEEVSVEEISKALSLSEIK